MAGNIKGITIEIGGNTVGLQNALADVNKKSTSLQKELREVERLLKFNPGNAEALAQKQKLLAEQVENTTEKLGRLKDAQEQVEEQFKQGTISEEQYRAFRREIEFTQGSLDAMTNKLAGLQAEQEQVSRSTKQLEALFSATGKSVDDFAGALGDKLTNAIKSGTASSKQLEEAIDKIGQEALGANVDLDKLKQALSNVDKGGSLDKVKKDLDELAKEAKKAEQSISDLGAGLENIAGALVAGGGLAGAMEIALDRSQLNTKIDVSFNVPEESKASIKDAVNQIQAYGVDAEAALEGTRRQWALNKEASDQANAEIVKGAAAITQAYSGIDFTELVQETNEVAAGLKISNQDALALINSLLKAGFPPEQLDTIAEYGMQMKNAGFSAKEIQAIFEKGIEVKSWNVDNLNDGIKEARIRMAEFGQEVPKALADLLQGTNVSVQQMQKWGQAVAQGGEAGAKAMGEMANWLTGIQDKTLQNAIATQVFGTMWEDQGTNLTSILSGLSDATDKTKQNQEQLNDTISKIDASPTVQMQKAMADLKTAVEPLLGVIASVVSSIATWVSANPGLAATITAIVTVLGILVGAAMALAPIFTAVTGVMATAGVGFAAVAAPIGIAIAAITAIVAIAALVISNWEPIKEFFAGLWDGIVSVFQAAGTAIATFLRENWQTILAVIAGPVGLLVKLIIDNWDAIKNIVTSVGNTIKSTVSSTWDAIKNTTASLWNGIKGTISSIWDSIKNTISTVVGSIKGSISGAWEAIKSVTQSVWDGVRNAIVSPIESAKQTMFGIIDTIKNAFAKLIISIPKPKLPHIDVDWKEFGVGDAKISIPTFDINWYKTGGIFTGPSVIGVGEAGKEAVVPLSGEHMRPFAEAIAKQMPGYGGITIQQMIVRDDQDIQKISRELYSLMTRSRTARGQR